jgi:hypothetical protein
MLGSLLLDREWKGKNTGFSPLGIRRVELRDIMLNSILLDRRVEGTECRVPFSSMGERKRHNAGFPPLG